MISTLVNLIAWSIKVINHLRDKNYRQLFSKYSYQNSTNSYLIFYISICLKRKFYKVNFCRTWSSIVMLILGKTKPCTKNWFPKIKFGNLSFWIFLKNGIYSMQGSTATTRHGVTRQWSTKRLIKATANLFRRNLQLIGIC